ncbi:peptidase M20 domain-containing protein 2 [Rhipicephalus sanguineus]|uniref:peptidase M20 domain-containing protein 2 n=1 Tax=Rhipicephalus sanguineus TaxID=34632 RepID=UPI001895FECC|nr:peptidase M20 domain-containing protein 2 [Rhipicephalus sanguineus]XP_049269265.1 peptidase M20 domain-containing protein 2 [Rhipicephalus sanguineus]
MGSFQTSRTNVREVVDEAVASRAEALHAVGRFLWENPEIRFEEHKAHDTLCNFLEGEGFDVRRHYFLETAFRAEYGEGSPVVAFLCEYDALPGLGHACGHNLIAESAITAAVAAKELIFRRNELSDAPVKGKIVVLGTPAEEGGMGKELLLRAGAMDDVDAALMAHPENRSVLRMRLSSRSGLTMVFDSVDVPDSEQQPSAMDAAVLAYSNMTLLRARMDPDSRIHGILSTETTASFNVRRSRLDMNVRSPSTERVLQMRRDVEACAEAAAKATGCRVTITDLGRLCKHMNYNETMVRIFQKHADKYGTPFADGPMTTGATSDAGNVSQRLPTIHPVYGIESTGFNHTTEFCRVAGTRKAQETALLIGKMLALTAFDLLCDPHLLECVKKEFDAFAAQAV